MFKRRNVFCTNCGFFCWGLYSPEDGSRTRIVGCPTYWRNRIQTDKVMGPKEDPETGEGINALCLRGQWVFAPNIKSSELDYIDVDRLIQQRKCPFFVKYQPGFSPEEHKELLRDAQTRETVFRAALLGAVIGACAAILAQILYIVFVVSP